MHFKYRAVAASLLLSTALLASHQALAQETIFIDDFVVSANRTPIEASKTGSSVTVVTGEELARSGARLIGDYIARLPGVSMTQNGPRGSTTNVRIRGLRGQYLKVIVDGIEISDPTQPQTIADFANIPVGDVARLEVLRGPQSSLYGGDAGAGVISITTRRAERQGVSHRYNLEVGTRKTLQGDYSVSTAGDAGTLTITAQGIHTNGFSAADERDGNAESDGLKFGAFSANGELNAGENIVLFGGLRYSSARVQYDSGFPIQDANFYQDTRSFAGRLGARWQMMDGRLENQLSLQYFSILRENFDNFPRVSDGERYKADYLGQYRFTDRFSIMFGGDAEMTRSVENNATREARVYGGFVQALAEPIDNLSLSLNGRLDGHSTFGNFTTYRASAAYTLAATMTTFRASYGGFQNAFPV